MAKKAGKVRLVSSKVMFKGRVFEVRRDQIIEPGVPKVTREIVRHPGSVVVLPVFPDGRILVIRQYRHATGQYMWELVAGHKEPKEDFRRGAARELQEETGYSARRYRKLLEIYPSPGLLSERMVIFLAEGLTKGEAHPEEDEMIEVRSLTLAEIERWIRNGKIQDAKSVAGLLYYAHFVRRS
ncbi:MAG: NUDIX hydrolase [Candidatus Acidiferrales bacterium]